MTITIHPLSLSMVLHVAQNMRRSDWIEVSNLVPRRICTPEGMAMLVIQHSGAGFVACVDGVPACVVQLVEKHDGCWSAGLFATDDFALCWRAVVKEIRHVIAPVLLDFGARYLEAHVMASNIPAQRLLERLGFKCVSEVLTNYGAFGKDFLLYAIRNREDCHVFLKPQGAGSSATG